MPRFAAIVITSYYNTILRQHTSRRHYATIALDTVADIVAVTLLHGYVVLHSHTEAPLLHTRTNTAGAITVGRWLRRAPY